MALRDADERGRDRRADPRVGCTPGSCSSAFRISSSPTGSGCCWCSVRAPISTCAITSSRLAQLEGETVRARLQALRMQLHPHFLFNTLHSVSGLIDSRPDRRAADHRAARGPAAPESARRRRRTWCRSRARSTSCATISRSSSSGSRTGCVSRSRSSRRCRTPWCPGLILQPLAENAVVHGASEEEERVQRHHRGAPGHRFDAARALARAQRAQHRQRTRGRRGLGRAHRHRQHARAPACAVRRALHGRVVGAAAGRLPGAPAHTACGRGAE